MRHAERLLLAHALLAQERPPADAGSFQRLVGPAGPLAGVTATCFLLFRSPGQSVALFLERIVPRLLAQLDRSTEPQRVLLRGRVRGAVDWSATVKARCAASRDPTLFVCRQSWRLYDLPENQLLKYLLVHLRRCHETAPAEVRDWPWPGRRPGLPGSRVGDPLAWTGSRLHRFGASAYLRDVETPPAIRGEHLAAAASARNPLYGQMADFYRFFASVVERPSWPEWSRVLRQNVGLLPDREARVLDQLMGPPPF